MMSNYVFKSRYNKTKKLIIKDVKKVYNEEDHVNKGNIYF